MPEDEGNDEEEPAVPEEHNHPAMGFLVPMGPTPDQIQRHQMAVTASQHDAYRIFTELDEPQLRSLQKMLHVINCGAADPNPVSEYFEGISTGILFSKHNICLACGVDHDKELQNMGGEVGDAGADGGTDGTSE